MKTIAILAAAAAALTSTIGMAHEGESRFVHDGQTYVYTATTAGARQVIDGRRLPSGERFHLVVRGDSVSGTSGGVPVAFKIASAQGAAGSFETASR